jgi:hypothetical protein
MTGSGEIGANRPDRYPLSAEKQQVIGESES